MTSNWKKTQNDLSKVKKDVSDMVEDSISQTSDSLDKMAGDAKKTIVDGAETVKKDIGHGLNQYNTKAQKFVNKLPYNIGENAEKYPWVTISIGVLIGLLLGGLLRRATRI